MRKPYHVGWYMRGRTAVFQFCKDIDFLNCEIVEYLGKRAVTKAGVKNTLPKHKAKIIDILSSKYPKYNINNIVIE